MSCLMEALEDKRVRLQPECKKRLNDRIEMWSYAAKVNMERISFFVLFFCLGSLTCELFIVNFSCNEILSLKFSVLRLVRND